MSSIFKATRIKRAIFDCDGQTAQAKSQAYLPIACGGDIILELMS